MQAPRDIVKPPIQPLHIPVLRPDQQCLLLEERQLLALRYSQPLLTPAKAVQARQKNHSPISLKLYDDLYPCLLLSCISHSGSIILLRASKWIPR